MLRSHLERGPAELVKLKIWGSSESSPVFGRALCDSHIQIGCLAYIFRTEVDPSPSEFWLTPRCHWPNMLYQSALGSKRHKLGRTSTRWGGPARLNACSIEKFKLLSGLRARWQRGANRSQLFNSTVKCDEEWAIPYFDKGPRTSLQIPRRICQFS